MAERCLTKYVDAELLERCAGTKALGALTKLNLCVPKVPGRRGDVGVLPPQQKIRRLENLEALQAVTHLAVDEQAIVKIENVVCMKALTHLSVKGNAIEKVEGLPAKLVSLDISRNVVDALPLSLGKACKELRCLHAADNKIAALSKVQGLRFMRNLETLDLRRNPVCDVEHYRSYVIWAAPSVSTLDGAEVRADERAEAEQRWQQEEILLKERALDLKDQQLSAQGEQVNSLEEAQVKHTTVLKQRSEEIRALHTSLHAMEAEKDKADKLAEERKKTIDDILLDLVMTKDALGRLLIMLEFDEEITADVLMRDVFTDEVREVVSRAASDKVRTATGMAFCDNASGFGVDVTQHARISALEASVVDTQKLKTKYERWKVDHAHTLMKAEERVATLEAQLASSGISTEPLTPGTEQTEVAALVASLRTENVELRQQVLGLEGSVDVAGTPSAPGPVSAGESSVSVAPDDAVLKEELASKELTIASLQAAAAEQKAAFARLQCQLRALESENQSIRARTAEGGTTGSLAPSTPAVGTAADAATFTSASESPRRPLSAALQGDADAEGINGRLDELEEQLAVMLGAAQRDGREKGLLMQDVDAMEAHLAALKRQVRGLEVLSDGKDTAISSLIEELDKLVVVSLGLRSKVHALEALVAALREKLTDAAGVLPMANAATSPLPSTHFAEVTELVDGLHAQLSGQEGSSGDGSPLPKNDEMCRMRVALAEATNNTRLLQERNGLLTEALTTIGIRDSGDGGALSEASLVQLRALQALQHEHNKAQARVASYESVLVALGLDPVMAGDSDTLGALLAKRDDEAEERKEIAVGYAELQEALRKLGVADAGLGNAEGRICALNNARFELQQAHRTAAARVEQLEADLAAAAVKHDRDAEALQRAEAAAAEALQRAEAAAAEVSDLQVAVARYEAMTLAKGREEEFACAMGTLKMDLRAKVAQVEAVTFERDAARRVEQGLVAQLGELKGASEKKVEALQEQLAVLKEQVEVLSSATDEKDAELLGLKDEVVALRNTRADMEHELASLRGDRAEYGRTKGEHIAVCQKLLDTEAALTKARGRIEDLQTAVAGMRHEVDARNMSEEVEELRERCRELEALTATQGESLTVLQRKVQVLSEEEEALRQHSARLVTKLEAADDAREAAVQELQRATAESDAQRAEFDRALQEKEAEVVQLRAREHDREAHFQSRLSRSDPAALQEQLAFLRRSKDAVDEQVTQQAEQIVRLNSALATSQEEANAAREAERHETSLRELNSTHESLKNEYSQLKDESRVSVPAADAPNARALLVDDLRAEVLHFKGIVIQLRQDLEARAREVQTLQEQNELLKAALPMRALPPVADLSEELNVAQARADGAAAQLQKEKADHIATHQRLEEAQKKLEILEAAVASVASSPARLPGLSHGLSPALASPALSATLPVTTMSTRGGSVQSAAEQRLATENEQLYHTVVEQEGELHKLRSTAKHLSDLQDSVHKIRSELEQALYSTAATGSPVVVPPELNAQGAPEDDPVSCVMSLAKKIRQHIEDERLRSLSPRPRAGGSHQRSVVTRRLLYPQTPEELERAEQGLANSPEARAKILSEAQEVMQELRDVEVYNETLVRMQDHLQRALDAKDARITQLEGCSTNPAAPSELWDRVETLISERDVLRGELTAARDELKVMAGRTAADPARADVYREAAALREQLRVINANHEGVVVEAAALRTQVRTLASTVAAKDEEVAALQKATRLLETTRARGDAGRDLQLQNELDAARADTAALRNVIAKHTESIATLQHMNALLEASPVRAGADTGSTDPCDEDAVKTLRRESMALRDERDMLHRDVASERAMVRTLERSVADMGHKIETLKQMNDLLRQAADQSAGAAYAQPPSGSDQHEEADDTRGKHTTAETAVLATTVGVASLEKEVARLESGRVEQEAAAVAQQRRVARLTVENERLVAALADEQRDAAALRQVNLAFATGGDAAAAAAALKDGYTPRSASTFMTTPTLPTPPQTGHGERSGSARLEFGSPTPPQASTATRGQGGAPPVLSGGESVSPQGSCADASLRRLENDKAGLVAEVKHLSTRVAGAQERIDRLLEVMASKDEEITALKQINSDMLENSTASLPPPREQAGEQMQLKAQLEEYKVDAVVAAALGEQKMRLELRLEEAEHHAVTQQKALTAHEEALRNKESALADSRTEAATLRDRIDVTEAESARLSRQAAAVAAEAAGLRSSEAALQERLKDSDRDSLEVTRQMVALQKEIAAAAAREAEIAQKEQAAAARDQESARQVAYAKQQVARLESQVASFITQKETQTETIDVLRGELSEVKSRSVLDASGFKEQIARLESQLSLSRVRFGNALLLSHSTQDDVAAELRGQLLAAAELNSGLLEGESETVRDLKNQVAELLVQKRETEREAKRLHREVQSTPRGADAASPGPPMVSPLELASVQHQLQTERLKNQRLEDELGALKGSLGALRSKNDQKLKQLRRMVEQSSARAEVGKLADMVSELLSLQHGGMSPARVRDPPPTAPLQQLPPAHLNEQALVKTELDASRMRSEIVELTAALTEANSKNGSWRDAAAHRERAEEELDRLHNEVASRDFELASLQAEAAMLKKRAAAHADMVREKQAAEAKVEELTAQQAVLRGKNTQLCEEVGALREKVASIHAKHEAAVDTNEHEQAALRARVQELQRGRQAGAEAAEEAEQQVAVLQTDLVCLQRRLDAAAAESAATLQLRAEARERQRALEDAERTERQLREAVAAAEDRADRAEAERRGLEAQPASRAVSTSTFVYTVALNKATQTYGTYEASAVERVATLEGAVDDLRRTVADLEAENGTLRAAARRPPPADLPMDRRPVGGDLAELDTLRLQMQGLQRDVHALSSHSRQAAPTASPPPQRLSVSPTLDPVQASPEGGEFTRTLPQGCFDTEMQRLTNLSDFEHSRRVRQARLKHPAAAAATDGPDGATERTPARDEAERPCPRSPDGEHPYLYDVDHKAGFGGVAGARQKRLEMFGVGGRVGGVLPSGLRIRGDPGAQPQQTPVGGLTQYEGHESHIMVPRSYLENVYRNTDLSRKFWRKAEADRAKRPLLR
eukprot:TRINITY_DN1556_c0_g1_i1.p1 TRINITY_DN1556_c0_g1~~TRINITY_DN1556_c0_g1_i1.p1  ORF type:complete len:3091 (+),score=799.97 TRINITY_DN1556_c0_g1_i1:100-9372(+)